MGLPFRQVLVAGGRGVFVFVIHNSRGGGGGFRTTSAGGVELRGVGGFPFPCLKSAFCHSNMNQFQITTNFKLHVCHAMLCTVVVCCGLVRCKVVSCGVVCRAVL